MSRQPASRTAETRRPGTPGTPEQGGQPAAQRKGWPFAEGSQNHLDETSAPWPRPSRLAPAKPSDNSKPGQ
ncbi:MAG: hypothetical protein ACT6Q9_18080 [Polaromonas sp.]|uniref:hypothetical protein n=1 Tax=Polaromonas sp. TaxID=1869339 RepID=UPI0040368DF9